MKPSPRSPAIFAGTSGYSFREWKGVFYPEELASDRWLGHYAGRLPAVEINNTFYRMPTRSVLESWAAQVPEGFRFAVKASRRITHSKRLQDTEEEIGLLMGNLASLGDHLGAVLFRLPPSLKCDLPRLEAFLALLPEGLPAAFEFRHASWLENPAVASRLADRGFALCHADTEDGPAGGPLPGGGFGYLRLRRPDYDDAALLDFAERIRSTGWERAFVFFKHETAGAGPKLAARFLALTTGASERRRPRPVRRAPRREREAG